MRRRPVPVLYHRFGVGNPHYLNNPNHYRGGIRL
ncbi:hypothetical protein [Dipodfec virus UOA04_Rod_781]|nr:hypothetical protein [Dipodfec virus UOA04_Rod_781]